MDGCDLKLIWTRAVILIILNVLLCTAVSILCGSSIRNSIELSWPRNWLVTEDYYIDVQRFSVILISELVIAIGCFVIIIAVSRLPYFATPPSPPHPGNLRLIKLCRSMMSCQVRGTKIVYMPSTTSVVFNSALVSLIYLYLLHY